MAPARIRFRCNGLLCAAAPLLLFAAQNLWAAAPPADERHVLTVAAATDSYPYSFLDDSGQFAGYAVDLLDAVADTMHVTLRRVPMTAAKAGSLSELRERGCDIGQFHAPIPGREDGGAYSPPILVNHGDIFVRSGERRIRSLETLRSARVRIATPLQGAEFLVAHGFDPALITGGTAGECLTALAQGEVDAAVLTRLTGLAQAHFLGLGNVEPVGAHLPGLKVAYAIATRQEDAALLAQINEALASLSVTGRTDEIYLRWFGRFERQGISALSLTLVVTASLALALVIALWALHHQRALRRQIAGQAAELSQNQEILAAAQSFAHLGHWQRKLLPVPSIEWSAETYRIFERDPALPPFTVDESVAVAVSHDRERWRAAIEASNQHAQAYDLDLTIEPRPGLIKIVHINARPVFDATGRQTGVFGTVHDISAPRAAEMELRRSEHLLRALYANLPFGLGVVEQSGDAWRFVSVNPPAQAHLALPADEASALSLHDSGLPAEWQNYWKNMLAECVRAGRLVTRELVRHDLRRVFITSVIPLERVEERARVCFLIEDVTERRRQESELAQGRRLRAIGELVGGIAHEFNNLLTPIRLGTEMLQADWKHHPALCAQLKLIGSAAERSGQLVQRLLTFGRQSESRSEEFELKAVIDANIELLRPTIDRRITLDSTLPARLPKLFLPTGAVHQVVVNLLLNARDTLAEKIASSPPAGWTPRVSIEATVLPPSALNDSLSSPVQPVTAWIRLTVRDTGCGMPPEVIERLFEPFYTTKPVGRGTGLGLATVWHLATGCGGRVQAESIAGEGSAFHVMLPVLPAPKGSAATGPAVSAEHAVATRRNLLLVDDEQAIAELVARFLSRRGHQITAVTNALEAWSLVSSAPDAYDAIIIDLNMPGINGVEFARRARALPYQRPIIVVSGRVTDADRQALAAVNVTAILGKPFALEEFESVLVNALGRSVSAQPFAR